MAFPKVGDDQSTPTPKPFPYPIRRPGIRPGEPSHFHAAEKIIVRDRGPVPSEETVADWLHPRVQRLRIHPSTTEGYVHWFANLFPSVINAWIRSLLPERFLPPNLVLKTIKLDGPELLQTEVKAHNALKPIQGITVPRMYDIARFRGANSLVLEDIDGTPMTEPPGLVLDFEKLKDRLEACLRELQSCGIHQQDANPRNLQSVNGRVMALDFERVVLNIPPAKQIHFMSIKISGVASRYRDF